MLIDQHGRDVSVRLLRRGHVFACVPVYLKTGVLRSSVTSTLMRGVNS